MSEVEETSLSALFAKAEYALQEQSPSAREVGWSAIRELFHHYDVWPDDAFDGVDFDLLDRDEVEMDVIRDTPEGRIFVWLQRRADEEGVDVDYGLQSE